MTRFTRQGLQGLALSVSFVLSVNTWALSSSENPSYDGSYTLTTSTPSSPTGPSSSSSGNYTIDWGDSTGASHYQYREYLTGWSEAVSTGGNSHITVSNKSSGRWYYQARACNPAGCSGWTGGDKYIDVARTPGVPSSLSVSPGASTTASHSVSWGGAAQTFTGLGNGFALFFIKPKNHVLRTW